MRGSSILSFIEFLDRIRLRQKTISSGNIEKASQLLEYLTIWPQCVRPKGPFLRNWLERTPSLAHHTRRKSIFNENCARTIIGEGILPAINMARATQDKVSPHFTTLLPSLTAVLEGMILHILCITTKSNDEAPTKNISMQAIQRSPVPTSDLLAIEI